METGPMGCVCVKVDGAEEIVMYPNAANMESSMRHRGSVFASLAIVVISAIICIAMQSHKNRVTDLALVL